MTRLRYYTSEALDLLRRTIADRLDWYYLAENSSPLEMPPGSIREARLEAPHLAKKLTMDSARPSSTDVDNALVVFRALAGLSSHQASIDRMWTYLCHQDCPQYVAWRWLNQRPKENKNAVQRVRNHFFATDSRALVRDNGISRLWWLGKIAHDVAPDDPHEFLTILLHRQDVRSALIERPSVSMNRRVLRGIYDIMRQHWENGGALFERETFRKWMVALNRRGGVVLLDALPEDALARLLREEAERALK